MVSAQLGGMGGGMGGIGAMIGPIVSGIITQMMGGGGGGMLGGGGPRTPTRRQALVQQISNRGPTDSAGLADLLLMQGRRSYRR